MAADPRAKPRRRLLAPLAAPALACLALAGCGSSVEEGSRLTVHVGGGHAATLAGAELALEQAGEVAGGVPVELEIAAADGGPASARPRWQQAQIAAAARAASEDSTAIAYLGEARSAATAVSLPVTNEAGILQVATGPVAEQLAREPGGNEVPREFQASGERTLVAAVVTGGAEPRPEPGFAADYEAAYGRPPELAAAYGHAAMTHVLDAIEDSDEPLDRAAVVAAALRSDPRESALGGYSIDAAGLGTLGG